MQRCMVIERERGLNRGGRCCNREWGWGNGRGGRGEGSRGITLSERWMCRWRGARCEGGGENTEMEVGGIFNGTGKERTGRGKEVK